MQGNIILNCSFYSFQLNLAAFFSFFSKSALFRKRTILIRLFFCFLFIIAQFGLFFLLKLLLSFFYDSVVSKCLKTRSGQQQQRTSSAEMGHRRLFGTEAAELLSRSGLGTSNHTCKFPDRVPCHCGH